MEHNELMNTLLFLDAGYIQALKMNDQSCEIVLNVNNLNPKYLNLVRGSLLMYQGLVKQWEALDVLIQVEEVKPGNQNLVTMLTAMQNAISINRRAVIEGVDVIANEFLTLRE